MEHGLVKSEDVLAGEEYPMPMSQSEFDQIIKQAQKMKAYRESQRRRRLSDVQRASWERKLVDGKPKRPYGNKTKP
jgi:hypothetical protein